MTRLLCRPEVRGPCAGSALSPAPAAASPRGGGRRRAGPHSPGKARQADRGGEKLSRKAGREKTGPCFGLCARPPWPGRRPGAEACAPPRPAGPERPGNGTGLGKGGKERERERPSLVPGLPGSGIPRPALPCARGACRNGVFLKGCLLPLLNLSWWSCGLRTAAGKSCSSSKVGVELEFEDLLWGYFLVLFCCLFNFLFFFP